MVFALRSGDWYLIDSGGRRTLVIGADCRGEEVAHAARDWVHQGGTVVVNGPDRHEFALGVLRHVAKRDALVVSDRAGGLTIGPDTT